MKHANLGNQPFDIEKVQKTQVLVNTCKMQMKLLKQLQKYITSVFSNNMKNKPNESTIQT